MTRRSGPRSQHLAGACHRYQALSGRFRLRRTCSSRQTCLASTAIHPIPPPRARQGSYHEPVGLTNDLKSRARELGFVAVGVTSAAPLKEAQPASLARAEARLIAAPPWGARHRA